MESNAPENKKGSEIAARTPINSLMSFDEFDNFFDDFILRKWPRLLDWNFPSRLERGLPKIDIIEHDNNVEIQAALPGVKKEDLDVSINNGNITIKASTREEKKEEGKYFRREITCGEFQRTFSLPADVDKDSAKAEFKDGLLKITIQKSESSKRKCIEVQ